MWRSGWGYEILQWLSISWPSPPLTWRCELRASPPTYRAVIKFDLSPPHHASLGDEFWWSNPTVLCPVEMFFIPHLAATWTCGYTVVLISSSSRSPFFIFPWWRVSWLLLLAVTLPFTARCLGSLELFSNSHLSVSCHWATSPASHLTITRTVCSEWTQAWWSSWSNFETFCSYNKD